MKIRRVVLGLVVLGGVLALILAWAGVFSSRQTIEPAPEGAGGDSGENTLVGKGFRSEGENWVLTAPEASAGLDNQQITLKKPVLEMDKAGGREGQHLRVEADSGSFDNNASAKQVDLSGNVVVTLSGTRTGTQNGVLKTQALRANLTEGTGETDQTVDVAISSLQGMQTMRGRGAEFSVKQRTVKVFSDIVMDIIGADVLPGGAPEAGDAAQSPRSAASATPVHVTCDGPALADGFKRTAQLNGHVVVTQDDRRLLADRLDLQFADVDAHAGAEPDRLVAGGHVQFVVGEVAGSCDQLVRTRVEKLLLLTGAPAVVKQGDSEIRADRIEMDVDTRSISVPVKGELAVRPAKPGAQSMAVTWESSLRFDPTAHVAVFRGNVLMARADQTLRCRTLRAHFDDTNRQVKDCLAEGDVKLDDGSRTMRANSLNVRLTDRNELSGFDASGNVSLEDEKFRLTSDRAVAAAGPNGQVQGFTATGRVAVRQAPSGGGPERTMTSQRAVAAFDKDGNVTGFTATGRVVVTEGERRMRAERVVATVGAKNLEKLIADGGVVSIAEKDLIAKGERLDWTLDSEGVLTGSPVELRQGRSRLYGERLEFSKELGSMRFTSSSRVEGAVERTGNESLPRVR